MPGCIIITDGATSSPDTGSRHEVNGKWIAHKEFSSIQCVVWPYTQVESYTESLYTLIGHKMLTEKRLKSQMNILRKRQSSLSLTQNIRSYRIHEELLLQLSNNTVSVVASVNIPDHGEASKCNIQSLLLPNS